MKKVILFLPFILFFFLGYKLLLSYEPSFQFYHWKQVYQEHNESNSPKYIKILDIYFSQNLKIQQTVFKTEPKSMTAVIYIDNGVFKQIKASSLLKKLKPKLESFSTIEYREIQVDCDWTPKTQKRYFAFLKLLKEESKKKISATIRLHQVKYYKKTGVPPVDYGVLMYYNMSDFLDINTKNYILDLDVAKKYHYNFDTYPLELNLALPLYSQASIIRFSKVVGAVEGMRVGDINENFKKIKENLYEIKKTDYFNSKLLYQGDKIRIDEVSIQDLQNALDGLKKVMKKPREILFYRWGNRKDYKKGFEKELLW